MAYFQHSPQQENGYTRQFAPVSPDNLPEEEQEEYEDASGRLYDDGFEDLEAPEEEEVPLSEEELHDQKQRRYRIAAGMGDLGATVLGVVVILVLVAFLINMLQFLSRDFSQNFSLLQTRF